MGTKSNVVRTALPKKRAAKKAAESSAVQAVIRSLNEATYLRDLRAKSADGAVIPAMDWIGTTVVAEPPAVTANSVGRAPLSAQASSIPYERALSDLAARGLTLDDLRRCKCCGLWFLSSSRKAEVCPECRPRKWPTTYRVKYRTQLAQQAGITPRTRKKGPPGKKPGSAK